MKRMCILAAAAILGGCATPRVYYSKLDREPAVPPRTDSLRIFMVRKNSETFTVQFAKSTEVVELRRIPGAIGDRQWVRLDTGGAVLAYLSRPKRLDVGDIAGRDGDSICVMFDSTLLASREPDAAALAGYAGTEWCGTLSAVEEVDWKEAFP